MSILAKRIYLNSKANKKYQNKMMNKMKQGFGKLASLKEAKEAIFGLVEEKDIEAIIAPKECTQEIIKFLKDYKFYNPSIISWDLIDKG